MSHFVCTGECAGESQHPGVCQDESCSLNGQPMVECNCDDGEHADVVGSTAGVEKYEE